MATSKKDWFVYILECEDTTLYTGIATDVERRFEEHLKGEGAKYTRAHKAKKLLYTEKHVTRGEAGKREVEIKSWPRSKKLELIQK